MKNKIVYADNAATTRLCKSAYIAMQPYLTQCFGNASSLYSVSREPRLALRNARNLIASSIGAKPNEIFFTSGGTEGDNWAIKGTAFSNYNKGKHIIVSSIEHHAVLNSCKFLEGIGYNITYLPVNHNGSIETDILKKAIKQDTILISIMLANNEIGNIIPIKELYKIAHSHGILFHTDAVQAIGHIPIDVNELGIDMLSASAHKFNGPKGIGFMYIKEGINIQPYLSGGSQEMRLRGGTENIANIVGMAVALDECISNMSERCEYTNMLTKKLTNLISESDLDYCINGSENRLPGLLNLSINNVDGETILHRLDLIGIEISTGSACNSTNTEVSHVIKAIGLPINYARGTIRISINHENSIEDIEYISNNLIKTCSSICKPDNEVL